MMFLCTYTLSAQTQLYFNNFDTYTVGGKIAQQAGAPWTTWSSAPGGAEDAVISSTQSSSPSNAIYVVNNNDLVFNIGDKTAGRYEVSWKMFVETGKLGYFNLLTNFAGGSSSWGFQAMICSDSIYIDAAGAVAAKVPYTVGNWKQLKLVIDLTDDFATFYIENNEIISYKWSKGANGDGTLVKLDGINFYGWPGGDPYPAGTSGYYIDDLKLDSVAAPESPANLTAVLNGANIDVAWTAPTTAPDAYKLSRNGSVVFSTPSVLTYTDNGPWPSTYNYVARAHYIGAGYSRSSNTATVVVPGGVTRNLVLMEKGTSINCTYCPYAAMGFRDLIDVNHKSAAAIAYHPMSSVWGSFVDIYGNASSENRLAYYEVEGFPTVTIDGGSKFGGVYGTVTQYPYYLPVYNQRIAQPSFHVLNMTIVPTTTDNYTATITVEQTYAAWASGIKLHTALTESNIVKSWGNQTEVDFVCRGMYPSADGTDLDFSSQNTQTVTLDFSAAGYIKDNCEFVAFVQHNASKEVTQVAKIDMSSIVGVEELKGNDISIYPNPASDYMMVLSNGKGNMQVVDITGKVVYTSSISNSTEVFDISKLNSGIYFVKVSTTDKNFTKKLIVE